MKSTLIVAEAGVNHNGSLEMANDLVRAAHTAGADVIKFQTWKTELLVTPQADLADYQQTGEDNSQYDMLKKLELSYDEFRRLKNTCDEVGIRFMSTPDEAESAHFLNELQNTFKIGSGELTNHPFLALIASFGKPVILSTGMASIKDIEQALSILKQSGLSLEKITLLHANTAYPTPDHDANLRAMLTLKERFHCAVGFSDHTQGIDIALAAVALGATVIEKHFTLDRSFVGPDHKASLDPQEFSALVQGIRRIEIALGSGEKTVTPSERGNIPIVRKGIYAAQPIAIGERLTEEKLMIKRPESDLAPGNWSRLVGRVARRDYQINDPISVQELEK